MIIDQPFTWFYGPVLRQVVEVQERSSQRGDGGNDSDWSWLNDQNDVSYLIERTQSQTLIWLAWWGWSASSPSSSWLWCNHRTIIAIIKTPPWHAWHRVSLPSTREAENQFHYFANVVTITHKPTPNTPPHYLHPHLGPQPGICCRPAEFSRSFPRPAPSISDLWWTSW